jgi:hypothetical protein
MQVLKLLAMVTSKNEIKKILKALDQGRCLANYIPKSFIHQTDTLNFKRGKKPSKFTWGTKM